jgi:hypothetical protein
VVSDVKNELAKQLTGTKDSTNNSSLKDTKQKTVETLKNTFGGFMKKKKTADSLKQQ